MTATVLAASSTKLWWYVSRSTGIVAWALTTAAVLWGLALSTRALGPRPPAPWLLDLHRFLGGLACVFVGFHLVGLVADNYTHWAWKEILIPMASSWKPGATAWGIVSLYLVVAIEATSLAMKRMPRKIWRAVHFSSFPLFLTASLHLLKAGTDRGNYVLRWIVLLSVVAVLFFTLYRIMMAYFGRSPKAQNRAAMLAAARNTAER
jgi:sulfoxide reductase heme-binding subunit YedZ